MPPPHPTWSGRRATKATTHTIQRDKGICWLCGHTGANSLDHIHPVITHPELMWEETNWKAAHYEKKTLEKDGYECIGNAGRGKKPWNQGPTRTWA